MKNTARFELTRLTRALASCSVLSLVPGLAMPQTLPTGLNVTTGSAQVNTQGSTMTVTNSAGAVLNWQSFNIGQGAAVRFEQPNAASQVLNRVLGNDPSAIFGSLSSNGRVWLLNPNGVIFGPSSRVDVAGLVTSTLRLNDADWLAGRFSFTGDAGHNATIVNQGELRTSLGGRVALIGGSVSNQGLIEAPGGQVVLAAGSSVELVDTGAPNLAVKVSAGSGEALNLGTLRAAGGRIDIHAAAVNQSGIVRADSATGNGGSVELRASGRTTLADGSITSASGGAGNGGSVMLLGNEVGLLGSARVDASGSAGGGEVLVGGGWQGKDVRVPNARAVYMGPSASISADATSQGDGGTVVLWGNEASRVYGSLSATGGSTGGNGGRIETSGGWLDAQPTLINVSAPAGASGNWLLDPFNIFISVEAGNSGTTGAPIFTANANDAQINSGTLQTALNAGTNVTITTGGPGNGSQAGNILMQQANINVTAASPGSLSIVADGSLTIEGSSIASTNGAMPVNLTANGAGGISMTNSTIASHNGAINLRAPALTMDASVLNSRAIVDAIVIAGIGNVGMGSFSSTNMVTPLVTPNGRWIAYLGFGIQDFNVGSFNHNFRRVGASFGAWAGDVGNGLVFSQAANLTLAGSASNKVYDGNTTATLNNVSGTGVVGETATLKNGVTGVFNNKNVGTAKPVGFSQADAFNVIDSQNKPVFGYTATGLTANITPLALPLTGITANNRTYTGNLVVTVTGTPTIAPLAGDVVTLSSNISYDLGTNQNNKNVGNNKPVFIRNASLSGADAGNYSLTLPSLTINVTQAPATLVGLTAQNKVYDGTTAASVTGSPSVNLGLDVFELVNVVGTPSASFDNKNAGTGKSVTISGLSLSGTTAGNYFLVANPLTANITPAPLLVSGLIVAPKVYDGTTTAVLSGTPSVSPLAGDVVGVQTGSLTGSFADKNVGSNKTVTLGGGITLTGAAAGNYTAQAPTTLVGTITQRPLELTGITANDRTYTGNLVVTVTGTPTIAPVAGDVVTLSSNISYDLGTNQNNRNVGNNKPVFIRNASLSGADAGNYSLTLPNLTINVTQAPATLVGLTAQNKVYDGTTAASVTGSPTVNLGLDVFELVSVVGTPSASFDNKNAGTGKSVTISGLSLSGTTASNYFLVANPLTATITPAPLLIGGLIVAPKVYDGTTTAVLSGTPSVSPVAGDVVGVQAGSLTGNFADKNVANNKAVTLGGITLTGADAGNYAPQAPTTLVGNITARPLNITGLAGASKVYDGTTSINLAGTAQIDAVAGDNVSLAGSLVGSFDTKNAGVNKPISLTGLSLSGSDSTNYALVQPAGLFGSITQRALTVSGLGVANKTYDGTITASLVTSGASLANVVSGDTVSLATGAASARFADKNAGTGKAVSVSGLGLTGADSGNYTVSAPTGLSANIARATATVTGLGAANKVYDGTTTAQLTGSGSLSGIVSGDVVTLPTSGLTGSFADKNVGNGKAVTLAGLSLAGADAGNYNVVAGSGITANITPRQVTLGGFTAAPRTYNGQTGVALSGGTITNAVSGDNISLTGTATGTMANANAGDAKPVTLGIGGLGLAGTDSGNYTLTGTPAPTGITVNIARADLFYLATAKTVQAGSEIGALTGIVEGFVGTDTLATAAVGTPVFTTTATATSAPGSYAILGGGLTATNYNLLQRPANNTALTLTPAPSASTPPAPATEVVRVLQNIVVAPPPASRESTGMADLSQTAGTSSSSAAGPVARKEDFGTVRLASLSPDAIQQLLASRDRYKKTAFAESISRLSVNPALADLRACANLREAEQGTCLVTEALQRQWAEQKARERPVAAAPTPAPAPAPAPGPAAAPTPAPAPVAAAPAAPAARPGAAPAATPAAERRRVRQAALPQIERKIALVVGVDTYADGAIPPLANSVKDARAMARVFESELGYETVVLENPSRSAVVAALNRLALDTTVLDSVVIYYAGHGELIEATKLGYWQLADADAKKPETWLSNTDIGRLVSRIPASQVALISDSCYSGSLVNEERIRASTSPVDPIAVLTRKTVVVMSSGGNEPVFDAGKNGHSPFAWSLMNTLQQVNNWRPGGQIFERVRFAVARELPQRPQYGASSAAGHQAGGDYLFEQRQLEAR